MSVASCPRCRDEVRVPAGVSDTAVVRCPLCMEEFELSEVGLPPLLEVVDGQELVGAAAAAGAAAAGEAGAGELGFSLQDERPGGDNPPAFSLAGDSAPAAGEEAPRPAPATRRRAGAKKKSGALRQVINIVGGGVIGLALGQLALWYLPGEWATQQRDPFSLGPTVAKYAPWLVPEQVSGVPLTDDGGGDQNGQQTSGQTAGDQDKQQKQGKRLAQVPDDMDLGNIGMNAGNGADNNAATNEAGTGGGVPGAGGDPTFTPPTIDDPLGTAGGDVPGTGGDPTFTPPTIDDPLGTAGGAPGTGGDTPGTGGPAVEPPTIDDPLLTPPDIGDPLGLDPPAVSEGGGDKNVERLVSSIEAASAAVLNVDNNFASMTREQRQAAGQELFEALAAAGEAAAKLGLDHRQVRTRRDELAQLLRQSPEDDVKGKVLSFLGNEQLTEKTTKPLVLLGEVESVGKDGDTPVVRLKTKDHSVLVLAAKDHDGSFEAGASIYVLGRRLPPAEHQRDGESHVVQAALLVRP